MMLPTVSMALHHPIEMKKLSALESLQSFVMAQLDGGELQLCLLLTQYCDTQKTNLT